MKDPAGTSLAGLSSRSTDEKEAKPDSSKTSSKHQRDLHPQPINAAAWAWHQRSGGATGGGSIEIARRVPNHAKVRRASRFKEEAMRLSCISDDAFFKGDPVIVGGSSLFDSYELISVVKQLEEALTNNGTENGFYSTSSKFHNKTSCGSRTRTRPSALICSSLDSLAIKNKMEHLGHEAKSVSENGCRTNFPFGHFSRRLSSYF